MSGHDLFASATGPDGRAVELKQATWDHVVAGHPELAEHLSDVLETIEHPELREDDPRPGRVRLFRRSGPDRWLRVVVEFGGESDLVVTAFPQSNDPAGWR